jgi:anti-sigma regulatory factor (Ser/Thr protein kinase)
MTTTISPLRPAATFRHDALFYAGQDEFVHRTGSFIRDGVRAEEPVLVVVSAAKIDLLRSELGDDAQKVRFADMDEVGTNPARIIPAWHEFVTEHSTGERPFRGVGEPIWPDRSPDELVECERHEALLNLAFDGGPDWWLACPYDVDALEPAVIDEAQRNHAFVLENGARRGSEMYRGLTDIARPFDQPLPEPHGPIQEMAFGAGDLSAIRTLVSDHTAAHGLGSTRGEDFVLAVNEVATNSLRHGGGRGVLRIWRNGKGLICEVRDDGKIEDPLVGRQRPSPTQMGGFGLWLVTHLCDLVQVRSFATGAVVRLHMSRS